MAEGEPGSTGAVERGPSSARGARPFAGRFGRLALLAACVALGWFVAGLAGGRVAAARRPSGPTVECLGSPSARHGVAYLHGVDTLGPAWPEIENRETLRALAADLDLRVALPRAPGGRWPQDGPEELETSLEWIREAAGRCFPPGTRFGVVGFSNGGWLAARLFQSCPPDGPAWLVAAGGGGLEGGGTRALRNCARFRLLAGRRDPGAAEAGGLLAAALSRRGADVELAVHGGGHRLPFRETRGVLARLLQPGPAP